MQPDLQPGQDSRQLVADVTHAEDRDRRPGGQGLQQDRHLPAATLPTVLVALVLVEPELQGLRSGASRRRSARRARRTVASSRLPPPTLPQLWSAPTTILAPASRGAWPRTAMTVDQHAGDAVPPQPLDRAQPVHVTPAPAPGPADCRGAPRRSARRPSRARPTVACLDRPVDRLGRGRAAQVDRDARSTERGDGVAQRLSHAERVHEGRLADRLRSVHHARLGRPLEQVHVELLRHLGEAGDLVRARRLRVQAAAVRAVAGVPAQLLEGQPAGALHEAALDLTDIDERGKAVADVVHDVGTQQPVRAGEAVHLHLRAATRRTRST